MWKLLLPIILLAFIVFLSLEKSLGFDLWQDDNALIFKLQHLEEQVGVFGAGPFGLGTYRYVAVPYIPIYKIFGLNTQVFYLFTIIIYFLASISIYLFTKYITKNNLIGFLAGAIFASGFVGSDGTLRLFNSVQTSYSIIFSLITFYFILQYFSKKKFLIYLISILSFYITIETGFVRTQYFLFPILVLIFLENTNIKKIKSFLLNFFYSIPFLLIFYFQYLLSPDPRSKLVNDYLNNLTQGKIESLHSFFATLGNLVLPTSLNNLLFEFTKTISFDFYNRSLFLEFLFLLLFLVLTHFLTIKKLKLKVLFFATFILWFIVNIIFFQGVGKHLNNPQDLSARNSLANFIGGSFLILTANYLLSSKNIVQSKFIIFLASWICLNILFYSIYLPLVPLDTQNRYLVHSFAPLAILLPIIFSHKSKIFTVTLCLTIVFIYIYLSRNYQKEFISEKSIPTRYFYTSLKTYLPEIKKDSVIWFDVANDPISQQQFKDFFSVGSMPDSTAIAVRYGIDRNDFTITQDFDEFIKNIKNQENFSSFFYSEEGLVDTTKAIKDNFVGNETGNDISISPIMLNIKAKMKFSENIQPSYCERPDLTTDKKKQLFDFLLSRNDYYKNSKITTTSQERGYPTKHVHDLDENSVWRGGRGFWMENQKEEIVIDLGKVKKINQFLWTNGYANSTPTIYSIEVSLDGKNWQTVKRVSNSEFSPNSKKVTDSFPEVEARFVKMEITDTFGHDSPAIREISILESQYSKLDETLIKEIENDPFVCISNKNDLLPVQNFLLKNGIEIPISIKTNKSANPAIVRINIIPDGIERNYQVIANPGGTEIKELKIESENKNYNLEVSKIKLRHLKLEEIN